MRIIGGAFKGRKLPRHKLKHTRPTTDRARESLFNILQLHFDLESISVLDLYAGTGIIGLEFMSRGVSDLTMVDASSAAVSYIKECAVLLDIQPKLVRSKALSFLATSSRSYTIIFADPPYRSEDYSRIHSMVAKGKLLRPGGWLILEHMSGMPLPEEGLFDQRSYGQSTFSFFTFD